MIASPALAQDQSVDRGVYVGLEAGAVLPDDYRTDIGRFLKDANTSSDIGWEAAALLGYDWGRFRTEIEGNYRTWGADEITSAQAGIPQSATTTATGTFDYEGDISLKSLMANALVDFGDADGLQFSLGAGAGRTWMDIQTNAANSSSDFLDTSDSEWAWQGIAQARMPVSDRVDVGLKYRYFSTLEFEPQDTRGRAIDFEVASHSVSLSLMMMLGSRPAPTPPPPVVLPEPARPAPPPPPPPPQALPSCNTGPYIVFFDFDRSDLTPEAASVLSSALSAYSVCGRANVMLAGHTDRSGSAAYNMGLAERRNTAVQTYLSGRGIPSADIMTEAFGETMPRVATADGVREPQNRRVEVTFGPGSGN
ncbi:OmpA family protein [Aurantiacibacter marinus]|uniref:OmpA-like domain-containing protein n=1 Tax=Aurantiacibacter marinus TaxID=874156 RepID=A0A0H0XS93_9SPHN|nr:OmpA family protein [Aurantiacibacter marinus]KLI64841.1 hypothetical protein AAV99_04860 [Aurantiacibacter marinus]